MKEGTRSELRQLPFTLGKLVGGILSVIGFGGLVYMLTRPPKPAVSVLLFAVAGILGVALFAFCSKAMSGEKARGAAVLKKTSSILPWAILLILAAVFIVIMLLISP